MDTANLTVHELDCLRQALIKYRDDCAEARDYMNNLALLHHGEELHLRIEVMCKLIEDTTPTGNEKLGE